MNNNNNKIFFVRLSNYETQENSFDVDFTLMDNGTFLREFVSLDPNIPIIETGSYSLEEILAAAREFIEEYKNTPRCYVSINYVEIWNSNNNK